MYYFNNQYIKIKQTIIYMLNEFVKKKYYTYFVPNFLR